jgi:hypothetical protein
MYEVVRHAERSSNAQPKPADQASRSAPVRAAVLPGGVLDRPAGALAVTRDHVTWPEIGGTSTCDIAAPRRVRTLDTRSGGAARSAALNE